MLTLDGLQIVIGDFALQADWQAKAGEALALIGSSGAGKSTLLMAIAGFIPLAKGRILWDGRDLAAVAPGQRPVTILFQDQNLFPHLTIAQNIGLGLSPGSRLTADQSVRVEAALDRVGLSGMAARKPADLSGGQQGRAALARALLRARPVLLLDEPFAALGPALRAEMLTLVREVAAETGALTILVSHDPADVRGFAIRTVLVADGQAHAPVPTAELFANPPPALRDYLG